MCEPRHVVEVARQAAWLFFGLVVSLWATAALADGPVNLVPDPSFETTAPPWFRDDGLLGCSVTKEAVADAPDGDQVLVIAGWTGDAILRAAPVPVASGTFSATLNARSFQLSGTAFVELVLFRGTTELGTFGKVELVGSGKWQHLDGRALRIASGDDSVTLALRVGGTSRGSRVEVDTVGLFRGARPRTVVNTAYFESFEAEDFESGGTSWRPMDHFPNWYHGFPSSRRMLSGADDARATENAPATKTLVIPAAGAYVLWTRFLRTTPALQGTFNVRIRQNGRVVVEQAIVDGSERYGSQPLDWVFTSSKLALNKGAAVIELSRPSSPAASWVGSKVDMLVLTNLIDYIPHIEDFATPGYVRFTNSGSTPLCLWQVVRRFQGPEYTVERMLTASGAWTRRLCPAEHAITPASSSPWFKLSDYLSDADDHNNVSFIATAPRSDSIPPIPLFKGVFDFAVGRYKHIIKTIPVNQSESRVSTTVATEYTERSILTSDEYLARERDALQRIVRPSRPVARHLDLSANLDGSIVGLDPQHLVEGELDVIHRMGFNGIYSPIAEDVNAPSFYKSHEIYHLGIWGAAPTFRGNDMSNIDLGKLDSDWMTLARRYGPILELVERAKIVDEPSAMGYDMIASKSAARRGFATFLQSLGLTAREVGVESLVDVGPITSADKRQNPNLFYWSGMYRLHLFGDVARSVVSAKRRARIDEHVNTYINYRPTWNGETFTDIGIDPFFTQRNGGFELSWSEDWLGWGLSVEQLSDHLAMLRAAGAPNKQELGMYIVGRDGPESLQRRRWYEALAAGVRHFSSYNYGPYYGSIDSWGTRYAMYPELAEILHDFGSIDEALDGTVRRKSDVALIYNRAATIWADGNPAFEQDSRYEFWALAHAGYQPDIIAEEDVERGRLDDYKAVFAWGPQMRRATARAIADWVHRGGTLFATAGTATLDEYNRPSRELDDTFGATSVSLSLVNRPGRPRYEFAKLEPLDTVSTQPYVEVPDVSFGRLCTTETLDVGVGAVPFMTSDSGAVVGVMNRSGAGRSFRVAALPGLAYVSEAIHDKSFDPELYHPTSFRPALRDLIAMAPNLAGAERVVTSGPAVEIVRYEGYDRLVVIVVNHGLPIPAFSVSVPSFSADSGFLASGAPVTVSSTNGWTRVGFRLDVADAIVLLRLHRSAGFSAPRPAERLAGCNCGVACGLEKRVPVTGSCALIALALSLAARRALRVRRSRSEDVQC